MSAATELDTVDVLTVDEAHSSRVNPEVTTPHITITSPARLRRGWVCHCPDGVAVARSAADGVAVMGMQVIGRTVRWEDRGMAQFPSMKARALERILRRPPLGYKLVRQKGSHRHFVAEGLPPLTFSYHDGASIPPGVVRKILLRDVGLSEVEALILLGME